MKPATNMRNWCKINKFAKRDNYYCKDSIQ